VKHQHIYIVSLAAAIAALALAGCGASSPIGLVDVQRIVANWPEYQNYQNQLLADERTIAGGRGNRGQKLRATIAMQQKYAKITEQLGIGVELGTPIDGSDDDADAEQRNGIVARAEAQMFGIRR